VWHIRRKFWNWIATFKFRHNKPAVIPVPREDRRPVLAVPFRSKFPAIPIDGLVVADHVPIDEAQPAKRLFSKFQALMYRVLSPMQSGLPPIDADADATLRWGYTRSHREWFPEPQHPKPADLGGLAVASPYACYLKATPEGAFRWDVSSLGGFECHGGLIPPGAIVNFRFDAERGLLDPTRIETALGSCTPGDAGWDASARLAMCSITTHLSLVRHFNWLHLVCGGPLAMATRNHLPAGHAVRRLLWPHVYGTQYSNEVVTLDQMCNGGDFESIFSFTPRGMCDLFEATAPDFDLASINPVVDGTRRGVDAPGVPAPALENRRALFDVFLRHAVRYLSLYYPSDDDLAKDPAVGAWLSDLEGSIPHGVGGITGGGAGIEATARLVATFIYLASVEHEVVGSGVWDYQLWSDASPIRVYADGRRVPLDVYQRLVNANFNLNVRRTMLLDDFSYLAINDPGAKAFTRFREELRDLQVALDASQPAPWRMEPKRLKANINA